MSARRVSVRKIRELLRLLWECGLSQRQVAGCCGIGKTTVVECVARARRSGLDWATAALLSDEELESRLYPPIELMPAAERPAVDWAVVHTELKRKDVTLSLLWEEYREREPRGYRYSWYCELYGQWRGRADLSMRQVHRRRGRSRAIPRRPSSSTMTTSRRPRPPTRRAPGAPPVSLDTWAQPD
jgi:transposase